MTKQILFFVLLAHLIHPLHGFSVLPGATRCRVVQKSHTLRATPAASTQEQTASEVPVTATKAKVKKEDKLTKEAEELLEAFQARKEGREGGPKLLVAQVAPSVRVAIPEEFGLQPGAFSPQVLVACLKELGFDLVLDTNTAADITIVEEGTELLKRIQARNGNENPKFGQGDPGPTPMPLFTSCCPGWMNFIEKSEPSLAPYISTCKSPHMMYGAFLKEYSQELLQHPAKEVYVTSVMPCVRKRGESDHDAFVHNGIREVDNVITTKDLGQLCRMKGIDPTKMIPIPFDSPIQMDGTGTGAGQLFGATGGVMEAAVRSVYELVTGQELPRIELEAVRGLEGVKEAIVPLHTETGEGMPIDLKIAVVSGLGNVKKLIKQMKDGEATYDFVEIMACPGGCIGGGGQPKAEEGTLEKRLEVIYSLDRSLPIRRSHENPNVKEFYGKYLGEYGGEKAHHLFHVEPVYGVPPEPTK